VRTNVCHVRSHSKHVAAGGRPCVDGRTLGRRVGDGVLRALRSLLVPLMAVVAGLVIGAVVLLLTGANQLSAYREVFARPAPGAQRSCSSRPSWTRCSRCPISSR